MPTLEATAQENFDISKLNRADAIRIAQSVKDKGDQFVAEYPRGAAERPPIDAYDLLSLADIATGGGKASEIQVPNIKTTLGSLKNWLVQQAGVTPEASPEKATLIAAAKYLEEAIKDLPRTIGQYEFVRSELPKITDDLLARAKLPDLYSRVPDVIGPGSTDLEIRQAFDNAISKINSANSLDWGLTSGLRDKFSVDIAAALDALQQARDVLLNPALRAQYDTRIQTGDRASEVILAKFAQVQPDSPFAKIKQLGVVEPDADDLECRMVTLRQIQERWNAINTAITAESKSRNPQVAAMYEKLQQNFEDLTSSNSALLDYKAEEHEKSKAEKISQLGSQQNIKLEEIRQVIAEANLDPLVDGGTNINYRRLGLSPGATKQEIKDVRTARVSLLNTILATQNFDDEDLNSAKRNINKAANNLTRLPGFVRNIADKMHAARNTVDEMANSSSERDPGFIGRVGRFLGLHRERTWQILGTVGAVALGVTVLSLGAWTAVGLLPALWGGAAAASGPSALLMNAMMGAGIAKGWVVGAAFASSAIAGMITLPLTREVFTGTVRYSGERIIKIYRNRTAAPLELLKQEFTEPNRVYAFLKEYRLAMADLLKITVDDKPRKKYQQLFDLHDMIVAIYRVPTFDLEIDVLSKSTIPADVEKLKKIRALKQRAETIDKEIGREVLMKEFNEEIKKFKIGVTLSPADRAIEMKDEDAMRQFEASLRAEQSAAKLWGQWASEPSPQAKDILVGRMKGESSEVIRQAREGVTRDPLEQILQLRHRWGLFPLLKASTPSRQGQGR